MSRIKARFEQLRAAERCALIPFVTAGDPDPSATVDLMQGMVAAGADLIELGVPFSDPMADGPVIQRATERALAKGVRLNDVLDMVRRFRERDSDTPVVLMGYLNPIEVHGYQAFSEQARDAGVDGVLIVDVPPEEAGDLVSALRAAELDLVYLLAPTSGPERIDKVATYASGFVYYVSVKGITGAGHLDVDAVAERLTPIRERIDLPLGVGFGIKDADTAARVAGVADAVIVGSAIVGRIEELVDEPARAVEVACEFVAELRRAIDGAATEASS